MAGHVRKQSVSTWKFLKKDCVRTSNKHFCSVYRRVLDAAARHCTTYTAVARDYLWALKQVICVWIFFWLAQASTSGVSVNVGQALTMMKIQARKASSIALNTRLKTSASWVQSLMTIPHMYLKSQISKSSPSNTGLSLTHTHTHAHN